MLSIVYMYMPIGVYIGIQTEGGQMDRRINRLIDERVGGFIGWQREANVWIDWQMDRQSK